MNQIQPYLGAKQNRGIIATNPVRAIGFRSYVMYVKLGFRAAQVQDLVRTAWEENPNMIRQRYVPDKLLEALIENMPTRDLEDYSGTPERFRRLKEMVAGIQRAKDMLTQAGLRGTYPELTKLREYTPEEITDWATQLSSAGCKYPTWVLTKLAEAAVKSGTTVDNLLDRRLNQNSGNGSSFEDLDNLAEEEGE